MFKLAFFIHDGAVQELSQQQQESLPQSTADSYTPRLGKEDACIIIRLAPICCYYYWGIPSLFWVLARARPDGEFKFGNPKDSEPVLDKI